MIKASLYHNRPTLTQNKYFEIKNTQININNTLNAWYLIRQKLQEQNIDLSTYDINPISDSKIVIFDEIPNKIPTKKQNQKFYLIALESIAIQPKNAHLKNYLQIFDKIFTYNDKLIDNKKIIKINYTFTQKPTLLNQKKEKFACLINSNKNSHHPHELYSERVKTIKWFEKNHPFELDLYGYNWDKPFKTTLFGKIYHKLNLHNFIKYPPLKVYKGIISNKSIISNYKFNFCYENIFGISGYITEKILDSFTFGSIPIYWGASNINQYIPTNTYIDRTKFFNHEDLYNYLKNISDQELINYQKNINKFLNSPQAQIFSIKNFVETIIFHIVN